MESVWLVAALWVGLALMASLISMRTAISVALADLDPRPIEVSISRMLLAHLVLGSNNLLEAMTPYLKSSGPVPGELAAYLDPRLERLDEFLAEARGLIEATLPTKGVRQKRTEAVRHRKTVKTEAPR